MYIFIDIKIICIFKEVFKFIINEFQIDIFSCLIQVLLTDFPGGAVVKNPPANARGTGLSPGLGRSHMLWSN